MREGKAVCGWARPVVTGRPVSGSARLTLLYVTSRATHLPRYCMRCCLLGRWMAASVCLVFVSSRVRITIILRCCVGSGCDENTNLGLTGCPVTRLFPQREAAFCAGCVWAGRREEGRRATGFVSWQTFSKRRGQSNIGRCCWCWGHAVTVQVSLSVGSGSTCSPGARPAFRCHVV